ncbi:hypothetical protein EAH87_02260 [Sphingomonas koreensis]|nr:hypothetical protein EAH87_02260 [Sphingomonas koreensis]
MRMMIIAALALAGASPATAADTKPTKAQLQSAEQTLSLIVGALNAKGVPQETKNGLFGCLYENSLSKIAAGTAAVIAKNKPLHGADPTVRLMVIAKVCGAPVPVPVDAPAKGK